MSENKQIILSVETWVDGSEYTIGRRIENYKVEITDEIDKNCITIKMEKSHKIAIIVSVIISFILPLLIVIIGFVFDINTIEKYLSNNKTKYTYVTSVTNNVNNKKANVYVSSFGTIDETIKDIINGVPEKITEVLDSDASTQNDGYALETSKEYAYIYIHTDQKVYIQVSEKEYVNDAGTTYHSTHNTYYHRSYYTRNRSSTYYSYANAARQQSINSRKTSGGGTSSGK